jgi:hypothetical protein
VGRGPGEEASPLLVSCNRAVGAGVAGPEGGDGAPVQGGVLDLKMLGKVVVEVVVGTEDCETWEHLSGVVHMGGWC